MVTAVTQMTGSAVAATGSQTSGQQPPMLSDLARQALDGLGKMSESYAAGNRAVEAQSSRIVAPGDVTAQFQAAQENMRVAMQVQQQVLQFSMATSISSSLGNNLNSFLKGA